MQKIPYDQFIDMLTAARTKVQPGTSWRHYNGGEYVVKDVALMEATMEIVVVYTPLTEANVSFVRPLASWLAMVDVNGQQIPRFTRNDAPAAAS